MGRFSWPENRSGNFFTTGAKSIELVCTKQYDQYLQVLDLTVKKSAKDFMKHKFNESSTTQLRNELESGKELQNITIKFLLSTMKPLHPGSLIDCSIS